MQLLLEKEKIYVVLLTWYGGKCCLVSVLTCHTTQYIVRYGCWAHISGMLGTHLRYAGARYAMPYL